MEMLAVNEDGYVVIPPNRLTSTLRLTLTLLCWFCVVAMEGNKESLAICCNPGIRFFHNGCIAGEAIKGLDTKCISPRGIIQMSVYNWCDIGLGEANTWPRPSIPRNRGCLGYGCHPCQKQVNEGYVQEYGLVHWDDWKCHEKKPGPVNRALCELPRLDSNQ